MSKSELFKFRSKGGKAVLKKYGKKHMSKIRKDAWDKIKENNSHDPTPEEISDNNN